MKTWPVLLALFAVGCSSTPPSEPAAEPAAPETSTKAEAAPSAPSSPAPAAAPAAAVKPASAVLTNQQVEAFAKKLAPRMGHGGLPADQLGAFVKTLQSVEKGKSQSGALHVDLNGRHIDVDLTVERLDANKLKVSLGGKDAAAVMELGKDLAASVK